MRLDTGPGEAALTGAPHATRIGQIPQLVVPGSLRRAAGVAGDLLALAAIAFCIPFVILGVGIPIALCVRLLLWIVGLPFSPAAS